MAVLPESMDRLDARDTGGSFQKIQDYVRYMRERIEFSFQNMARTVSAAGVSNTEMYSLIQTHTQTLAALQSKLNGISGDITALQTTAASQESTIAAMQERLAASEGKIDELQALYDSLAASYSALSDRVTVLEQRIAE